VPAFSVTTAAQQLVAPNRERTEVVVYNAGTADEAVRVDKDRNAVVASGNVIHNRETIKFRGAIAKGGLWIIGSASVTVNYTEVL
jgi:hypothetical protein